MSAHTKKHHTNSDVVEVFLKFPGKKSRHSYIPIESVGHFESLLNKYEENDSVDWEVIEKNNIAKRKQAGIVLRGARFREDMSQKELAKRSGVSQDNISRIENGKRGVGKVVAKKLAKPLKINYLLLLEEII